ncbi:hypothetical protein UY3_08678 [Chelonia mydas]|uniref:Uncharacterized protein n=1 Tax=Chelonia mydas TaxID=8469 RepID=M7BQ36_CHEMY|nr:hypothetical protein UY3_08678 [Chelonia mydas]
MKPVLSRLPECGDVEAVENPQQKRRNKETRSVQNTLSRFHYLLINDSNSVISQLKASSFLCSILKMDNLVNIPGWFVEASGRGKL